LNIGQYAAQLADANIDGIFLKELDEKVLVEEFGFKRNLILGAGGFPTATISSLFCVDGSPIEKLFSC
jgi:alanine racemase